jgi:amidase
MGETRTTSFASNANPPQGTEPIFWSATQMAAAIREKRISSFELVSAHIERIRAVNPALNAVVQFRPEAALEEARAADAALARGDTLGLLHGVPFTVKDYMAIDGLISTYGTLGLAHNVMHHNCEVVNRLRGAGGIALGLTNMPEFGASVETENLVYGRTSNPYDLSRFPGGSSGGETAIIAAGGSPLGVGGDSGGSIREPAHYCGLAGLKPTTGRIPRTGFLFQPRDALSFKQQVGPIARYVEDLTLGMRILAGSDGRDPSVVDMPFRDPADVDVRRLRIAFLTDNGIVPCDPSVVDTVYKAADAFRDAGASVTRAAPPDISRTYELYGRLSGCTGAKAARQHLADIGTVQVSDYLDSVLRMAERFDGMTAAEFMALSTEWDVFREQMLVFMQDYDVIVSPTTSIPAMPHRSSLSDRNVALSFTYAATYNLTGWPAATVRCGTSPDGLPIGVQVAARSWREDLVLAAAGFLEQTCGGYQRPPL